MRMRQKILGENGSSWLLHFRHPKNWVSRPCYRRVPEVKKSRWAIYASCAATHFFFIVLSVCTTLAPADFASGWLSSEEQLCKLVPEASKLVFSVTSFSISSKESAYFSTNCFKKGEFNIADFRSLIGFWTIGQIGDFEANQPVTKSADSDIVQPKRTNRGNWVTTQEAYFAHFDYLILGTRWW